jgi:hypothetical protein
MGATMLIAHIDPDGNIDNFGEAADLYPDTSFPVDGPEQEWMTDNNCLYVFENPPYNPVTQSLVPSDPYILTVNGVDGVYVNSVVDLTPEEIANALASVMHSVSMTRNQMINRTNWTQIADSGLASEDVAAWATFRLAVRQTCQDFMDSNREVAPTWPTPPQDIDDYVLAFLSNGDPQTPGGDPTTPPPPPAPAPDPAPAPSPGGGPLSPQPLVMSPAPSPDA